ncbi:uncharacterized protein LOC143230519 [Tachypleus tridentatus]|uniref:uncharacterized protein LOC143230519 n=1 Tax=Tachypleus tridentatus TaxID=6853 RepID=UPI003FCEF8B1
MQQSSYLVNLPEPVLYRICCFLISPFDLLNFGSTCKRLREVSSPPSLWLKIIFSWCKGVWQWIDIPQTTVPRDWLIELFCICCSTSPKTLHNCDMGLGEEWVRTESKQFRCMLGMLRYSYVDRDERHNPTVLYRRWLFDIGLYRRINPTINFAKEDLVLENSTIKEMVALGQAKERDLRSRKRRFSNLSLKYYIKRIESAKDGWYEDLFPSGPRGSLCPLLLCPSEVGYTSEMSGTSGVATLVSIVLADYLSPLCLSGEITLPQMAHTIQKACYSLRVNLEVLLPLQRQQWNSQPFRHAVISMAEEGWPSLDTWQLDLDQLRIKLHWREIMQQCSQYLEEHHWLDTVIDNVRGRWRNSLLGEIRSVLQGDEKTPCTVTRFNLTDCDLIGGDNRRQEMAAAAFISDTGVMVTWQLVGKNDF